MRFSSLRAAQGESLSGFVVGLACSISTSSSACQKNRYCEMVVPSTATKLVTKVFEKENDGRRVALSAVVQGICTTNTVATNRLEATKQNFEQVLRVALDPVQMGLSVQSVKSQSLQASRGATDFGEYFAYFSFFLVISALLLTTLFFKLGIEQRLREIGLLRAIGFSTKQIRSLFLREGLLLAVIGSLTGLLGAVAYGWLMMFGLRTWWVGAVGTTQLRLHVSPQSSAIPLGKAIGQVHRDR